MALPAVVDSSNPLPPISRIPLELLSQIFVCANTYDLSIGAHGAVESRGFDWGALLPSHVCRLWREVALCTPRMWTEIQVSDQASNVHLVALFLSRSKDAPLRVLARPCSSNGVQALRLVVPNFHRLELMYLHLPPGLQSAGVLLDETVLAVPRRSHFLKILEIVDRRGDNLPVHQRNPMPVSFNAHHSSRLQELSVIGSPFDWGEHSLPLSLTRLEVHYDGTYGGAYTVGAVVNALKDLAALISLSLRNIFSLENTLDIYPCCKIFLPSLQRISLNSSALACVRFLDLCDLPTGCTKFLRFSHSDTYNKLAPTLNSILHSGTVEFGKQPVYKMSLYSFYRVEFFKRTPSLHAMNDKPNLIIMTDYELMESPQANVFRICHLADSLEGVSELSLEVPLHWRTLGWDRLLQSLPSVESLSISHCSAFLLCEMLFPLTNTPILPRLKRVHLYSVVFEAGSFMQLIADLCRRNVAGLQYRLNTIVLSKCSGDTVLEHLSTLEEVVDVVVVV